ncbi:uncharacterized protein L3040_000026 [Drepanopeziza brunnea f. sp. 'multigermtubi']|uniref:uncharacterized protein n=1 Tax=Drepanopeziza brunnea f. sp. 'multigermtubi' TaxID=698441 RepID=UPI00239842C1|nr:hypothetical protein L3040_000026 [Drepanopeziza brunnea f. sp. 'multigermtubi']
MKAGRDSACCMTAITPAVAGPSALQLKTCIRIGSSCVCVKNGKIPIEARQINGLVKAQLYRAKLSVAISISAATEKHAVSSFSCSRRLWNVRASL